MTYWIIGSCMFGFIVVLGIGIVALTTIAKMAQDFPLPPKKEEYK